MRLGILFILSVNQFHSTLWDRCHNLALLETYTTKESLELPSFLDVAREVTEDPHYSMYYLSALTTTSTEVSTDNASGTGDTSKH